VGGGEVGRWAGGEVERRRGGEVGEVWWGGGEVGGWVARPGPAWPGW